MKALVTGAGGFLGGAITRQLLAAGHTVTAVARGDYPALTAAGVKVVRADLAGGELAPIFDGQDVVFHVAAKTGVWGPTAEFERTNVEGTRQVIAACRQAGVPKLVFTSSPSVIFDGHDHTNAGPDLPYPTHYESDYPRTKAEAERMALAANSPELATVSLRPHLIWGPGDPHLLPRVIKRARQGRLRIVGEGRNEVSITYIDNAAAAHLQAAAHIHPGASGAGRAFFVNDPTPIVLWDWLNGIFAQLQIPPVRRKVSVNLARRVGGVLEWVWRTFNLSGEPPMTRFVAAQLGSSHTYDIRPAQQHLGYQPVVGPEEAMARTLEYFRGLRV